MPDRDYPKIAYQDGEAFLVNTGRPMPGKPVESEWADLFEGRVYDRETGTLQPQHGRPLSVGSFLNHGEWFVVTLPPVEVAALEARVAALLAAEYG